MPPAKTSPRTAGDPARPLAGALPVDLPPIYSVAGLRELEAAARQRWPEISLMARAGQAAAEQAIRMLAPAGRRVLVVAGPGNNGGDGLEAATCLRRAFYDVSVLLLGDPARLGGDAAGALSHWAQAGGTLCQDIPERRFDLIIDALFGIGLDRPLEGAARALIERVNRSGTPVLALDIPSGVSGDTGAVMGAAVHATHTISFIALKPGLLTLEGPDCSGTLSVASLGPDWPALRAPEGFLLSGAALQMRPGARPRNFHKGQAGTVTIAGGSPGMAGAALIAGRAALKLGAGRVHLRLPEDSGLALDPLTPELMIGPAHRGIPPSEAIAVGPGLGQSAKARALLEAVLAPGTARPAAAAAGLVIDADAINLIASDPGLAAAVAAYPGTKILTPHPAEAARLLQADVAAIQADRIATARQIADRFGACTILKGNGSIVAAPGWGPGTALPPFAINGSGNPGMASAGMGDALSGFVAALLGQGLEGFQAACLATWLHGAAADRLLASGIGPVGITASDVIAAARELINAPEAPGHP
jgi:ADP-dependent NAD(P)H-hydrate dehydratase / NAD(P)H-hydrate epimerase